MASGAYTLAKYLMELNPLLKFDLDAILSGGLLHDVGKVLEYDRKDGKIVKGSFGKFVRHPMSGCALVLEVGLPAEIAHIVAAHSHEGDSGPRSLEANLVHHMDFINFESYKIVLGVK